MPPERYAQLISHYYDLFLILNAFCDKSETDRFIVHCSMLIYPRHMSPTRTSLYEHRTLSWRIAKADFGLMAPTLLAKGRKEGLSTFRCKPIEEMPNCGHVGL